MSETEPSRPSLLARIIAYPLTLLVIQFVVVTAVAATASRLIAPLLPRNTPISALGAAVVAALAVMAFAVTRRWIERAPLTEFSLPGAGRELGLGLAGGALLFSAGAGIVALLGGMEVLGIRGTGQLWSMLAMAIVSGVIEEVLFRGVLLRQLERLIGSWGALAVTAVLFGAAHLANEGATWFAALAIAAEAGVMLGAAWLLTRRLWLAIGLHAGWNFTQGWVFSVPVSGGDAPLGLLITRRVGPDWLTGGAFGLEAAVPVMVLASIAGALLLRAAVRRGGIMPPRWRQGDQTKL